jgi:hypothetical protein
MDKQGGCFCERNHQAFFGADGSRASADSGYQFYFGSGRNSDFRRSESDNSSICGYSWGTGSHSAVWDYRMQAFVREPVFWKSGKRFGKIYKEKKKSSKRKKEIVTFFYL